MSAALADPDRLQQLQLLRSSALAFSAKESPPARARALRAEAPVSTRVSITDCP